MKTPGLLCFALLLAACPKRAETRPPPTEVPVDEIARPFTEGEWLRGISVALIHDGTAEFHAYGRAFDDRPGAPDEHTLFEIGSATKVFTSTELALAVQRGAVRLATPVAELVPPGCAPAEANPRGVTLEELSTHTAGLPRMPTNFAPANPLDPFADYTREKLCAYLSGFTLGKPLPAPYAYSNVGAGLLGDALSQKAGKPYEQLIHDDLAAPLGLGETTITLTPEQKPRFATGADGDLESVPPWTFDALAGAGALRSTASDLSKFVLAELSPPAGDLGAALTATQAVHAQRPDGQMGLGWHIGVSTDPEVRWHNGQTGGFHSFIAFDPQAKVGVVMLTNTGTMLGDVLGVALLRALKHEPYKVELPKLVHVAPETLERYVGTYELAPGAVFTFTRDGDRLYAQLTGQQRLRVYPTSDTEFTYRAVQATLSFEATGTDPATAVVLHQNGKDVRAPRTAAR